MAQSQPEKNQNTDAEIYAGKLGALIQFINSWV